MAITAFTSPKAPLWPLGKITVATPGTVIQLNNNVTSQAQKPSSTPTGEGRILVLSASSSNTGAMYLLTNVQGQTVSATGTPNFVVAVVFPGQTIPLPPTGFFNGIQPDQYCVDADTAGNSMFATLYVG